MFFLHYRNRLRHRDEIDTLRLRSKWLCVEDRTLMQMVFEKGCSFRQIARLTGQNPSTVSRRFHRLVRRLIARKPAFAQGPPVYTDPTDIRIIQDYYLRGQTQKAIAQKRSISLYRIRNTLRAVRSILCTHNPSAPRNIRRSRQNRKTKRNKTPICIRKRSRPCIP